MKESTGRKSFFFLSATAFALFLSLAIAYVDYSEWPFRGESSIGDVENLAGPFGSLLAWLAIGSLGRLFSWFFPAAVLALGFGSLAGRQKRVSVGILKFLFFLFLLNAFFSMMGYGEDPALLSGWVGRALAGGVSAVFGRTGGTILVVAVLLILLTRIRFIASWTIGSASGLMEKRGFFAAIPGWIGSALRGVFRVVPGVLSRISGSIGRVRGGGGGDDIAYDEDIVLETPEPEEPREPVHEPVMRSVAGTDSDAGVDVSADSGRPRKKARRERKVEPGRSVEEASLPPLSLLERGGEGGVHYTRERLKAWAGVLEDKLAKYNIKGKVRAINHGPLITTFEFEPDPGVKVKDIVSRQDDISLAMEAASLRLIAPIPGKSVVGIEVPNPEGSMVHLRDILEEIPERLRFSGVMIAVGVDVMGKPFFMNLCNAPHLLVAGTTGSGKSVNLHCILTSILMQYRPADVRLLIVDPKMVEMNVYNGIPHLLHPVTNDPRETVRVFNYLIEEMQKRKELFREAGVKNIESYNSKLALENVSEEVGEKLPYIVLVVDELGDLVLTKGTDLESLLSRLANMARAVGIHMVVATQRPSVDVIVGKTKANFPTRIAFRVASKVDSRTILDSVGAEKLIGRGDMLYTDARHLDPIRLHGAYVSEAEVERVVEHWKSYEFEEDYLEMEETATTEDWNVDEHDPLYETAKETVIRYRQGSTSLLQRKLHVGYARAARLLDRLEHEGIVGPPEGSKPRKVLVEESSRQGAGD